MSKRSHDCQLLTVITFLFCDLVQSTLVVAMERVNNVKLFAHTGRVQSVVVHAVVVFLYDLPDLKVLTSYSKLNRWVAVAVAWLPPGIDLYE